MPHSGHILLHRVAHAQHLDAFVLDISVRQTFGVACDDEKKCIFQAAASLMQDTVGVVGGPRDIGVVCIWGGQGSKSR